ncbi:MAG: hypothetical protein JST40_06635 [Armatimonadetes bacterium]|nr:hypothetical protein [Armatimonadota bacterium]
MMTLYVLGMAAFYGMMVMTTPHKEEAEATHPAVPLHIVNGHQLLQIVDGGASDQSRAA